MINTKTRLGLASEVVIAALCTLLVARPAAGQTTGGGSAPTRPVTVTNPDWLIKPTAADLARVWPAEARAKGVDGAAKLECTVNVDGSLDPCKVISEAPAGLGFGNAALKAAKSFVMKPMTRNGAPVGGATVIIPLRFHAANGPPGSVITNPDWLKRPSADDLASVWPAEALRQGVGGEARIQCVVLADGALDQCVVTQESPTGVGFGHAALMASKYFMLRPQLVNGVPIGGGVVIIPLHFSDPGPRAQVLNTITVLNDPPWSAVATPAQIAAAFPRSQLGRAKAVHVVLRCRVWVDGGMGHCDPVVGADEDPSFEAAAQGLTKFYRINRAAYGKQSFANTYVDLSFIFSPPTGQ